MLYWTIFAGDVSFFIPRLNETKVFYFLIFYFPIFKMFLTWRKIVSETWNCSYGHVSESLPNSWFFVISKSAEIFKKYVPEQLMGRKWSYLTISLWKWVQTIFLVPKSYFEQVLRKSDLFARLLTIFRKLVLLY